MGTVADKIKYIDGTKSAIKEAIIKKGVEVDDSLPFRQYADKIKAIEGGGSATFEAVNGLGRIPEVGEKVFAQEVNQTTKPMGRFGFESSYYPRLLLNTVALRGIYCPRYVYSYNEETGASEVVYNIDVEEDFIRYLSNFKCYTCDGGNTSTLVILRENDYLSLTLSTSYSGIISDQFCFDSTSGFQKIYKLTDDGIGEEVATTPKTNIYQLYILGLHNSNVFYLFNGSMVIPYEIDLESKTCKQLGNGTSLSNFRGLAGVTLDNKYLLCFGYDKGIMCKIADDYSLEIDARLSLDGNISFNPYNGILCTSHASDNTLPPSVFKYENGEFIQLQLDTTGTEQPQYHFSAPTVSGDGSYLLSKANSYSYLYKLDKSSGGYKAVECVRNNFTTEGITATVVSGDLENLTLTPAGPK